MDAVMTALAEQHAELAALLEGLDAGGWARVSGCEGWTVADVVLHLAQTDELAVASAEGRLAEHARHLAGGAGTSSSGPGLDGTVDDLVARLVAAERDQPPATVHRRWTESAARLREVLGACDPGRRVDWVAGQLSARTLATTRLAETWIHTLDVAAASGPPPAPTGRLWHIARLAWRTIPYAFDRAGRSRPGPVAFHLRGPHGEAWDFEPGPDAPTRIRGDAHELCLVAARRLDPEATALTGEGPDAAAVLELVRTYA